MDEIINALARFITVALLDTRHSRHSWSLSLQRKVKCRRRSALSEKTESASKFCVDKGYTSGEEMASYLPPPDESYSDSGGQVYSLIIFYEYIVCNKLCEE